jgi:hypothetical protein
MQHKIQYSKWYHLKDVSDLKQYFPIEISDILFAMREMKNT